MKYLAVTCVFLALCVVILFNMYKDSRNEINTLKNEKKALITSIEEMRNAEMEANRTIKRLREAALSGKDNMDWYAGIIPYDVLSVLQERHNRHRKN